MYPIGIYLVTHTSDIDRSVESELSLMQAPVERHLSTVSDCLSLLDSSEEDPKLFVVEISSEEDIPWLAKLNDRFVGFPILAVVEVAENPRLLVSAMRAGAAQVVRAPVDSRDFQEAMHRIATQFGHTPAPCEVIAVVSADAGAGSTTVSIELASQIARMTELRCVLAEATTSYGRLAYRLNLDPSLSTYDLMKQSSRLDRKLMQQAASPVDTNFQVIAGPSKEITEFEPDLASILKGQQLLQQICDVLIIDISAEINKLTFDYLKSVDQILLVGQQRITSVTGMSAILKKFEEKHIGARTIAVINKYNRKLKSLTADSVRDLLGLSEIVTIRREEELFWKCENEGKTVHQMTLFAKVTQDFENLAERVLHRTADAKKRGVISRLLHLHS